ncbi:hypothetical protein [Mesorhizobium sp. A556]
MFRGGSRILRRHVELQIGRLVENPLLLFTLAFAAYGISRTLHDITDSFGYVVIPFTLLAFLLLLLFHFRREIDVFPPETISRGAGYRMFVPHNVANEENYNDVSKVIANCQKIFGAAAIDPLEDMKAWRSDPYSMVILKSGDNILGFLDFYFFRPGDFDAYLKGDRTFDELHAQSVLPDPAARSAKIVYVATVVHFEFCSVARRENQYRSEIYMIVSAALRALLKYQDFPEDGLDFYSSAWSEEGRRMLERFGFSEDKDYRKRNIFDRAMFSLKSVRREQVERIVGELSNRRIPEIMDI